jgi:SAM-dependent methyltransferase
MDKNMPDSTEHAPRAIHEYRTVAKSFGSDPERYDRTRPGYPDALIDQIVADSPGREVLDVGCGTGIAARQLQATGCTVLGVEPDARMAEFARNHTGIDVEVATLEDWPARGRLFDTIVAGTAWHWVDPVAGAAKAAQALRPGGLLAVFGNVAELPPQVQEAFAAVFRRVAPDSPFAGSAASGNGALDAYERLYAKAADGIRQTGQFTDPHQHRFDWQHTYTRDEWLDQLPTQGSLTRLPADKLGQVLDGVGAAIDQLGGSFTLTYATIAVTAAQIGAT